MILLDAHAHLHTHFDLGLYLDAARDNFVRAASRSSGNSRWTGVLVLADSGGEDSICRLRHALKDSAGNCAGDVKGWKLQSTSEEISICLISDTGDRIVVIAGRQIATRQALEVLAVGTRAKFAVGLTLSEAVSEVNAAGAIPIVPWGFGKWLGGRGRRVEHLIRDKGTPRFFLGENGNRPSIWPRSSLFELAEERGILNLPGSDPLPLASENDRSGDTGCIVHGALDLEAPARDLNDKLLSPDVRVEPYRASRSSLRILWNQLQVNFGASW